MTRVQSILSCVAVAVLCSVTAWSLDIGKLTKAAEHPQDSHPDLSGLTAPPMPDEAVRKHEHGQCVVRTKFNVLGLPDKVEVYHSSGYKDLDEASVSWALAHWRGPSNVTVQSTCHYDYRDGVDFAHP